MTKWITYQDQTLDIVNIKEEPTSETCPECGKGPVVLLRGTDQEEKHWVTVVCKACGYLNLACPNPEA